MVHLKHMAQRNMVSNKLPRLYPLPIPQNKSHCHIPILFLINTLWMNCPVVMRSLTVVRSVAVLVKKYCSLAFHFSTHTYCRWSSVLQLYLYSVLYLVGMYSKESWCLGCTLKWVCSIRTPGRDGEAAWVELGADGVPGVAPHLGTVPLQVCQCVVASQPPLTRHARHFPRLSVCVVAGIEGVNEILQSFLHSRFPY